MKHRNLRIGSLIRDELGKIIMREIEFPECLVTITEVEVDKQMDSADVFVSVIPSAEAEKTMRKLNYKLSPL